MLELLVWVPQIQREIYSFLKPNRMKALRRIFVEVAKPTFMM